VKREIGEIWASTDAPPYTDIFHERTGSAEVWRAVSIMRAVDDELQRLKAIPVPRADAISAHMNRVILYLVHQDDRIRIGYRDSNANGALVVEARKTVEPIYLKVSDYLERYHPNDYLAVFCKNIGKCEDLVSHLSRGSGSSEDPAGQIQLI
jgi:hypothetical protein